LSEVPFEVALKLERRLVTLPRVRVQRAPSDGGEQGRCVRPDLLDGGFGVLNACLQHGRPSLTRGPATASHGLPQHDAHGIEIGPSVSGFSEALFRCRVTQLALEDALLGRSERARGLGDPEIHELDLAAVTDDDVRRAHVPMDDSERCPIEVPRLVGVMEPGQHLRQNPKVLIERRVHSPDSP
jgi:hypothetical protein